MKQAKMQVILGTSAIRAFVAAPISVKTLGVVRMGLEFGLLCQDSAGDYLRFNGSVSEKLDHDEVLDALQHAMGSGRHTPQSAPLFCDTPARPVVTFRKRRHVPAADAVEHVLQIA